MKPMRAIRLLLLLTCRDAAPLLSRDIDHALAAPERAALRVHLWICPSCRRYRGQLDLIRRIVSLYRAKALGVGLKPLPEDAKARVRLELARRAGAV